MLTSNLKNDGENIVFTGEYMEAYIPEFYFESNLAEEVGSRISLLGLFNVRVFNNKNTPGKLETVNLPTMIQSFPSEVVKQQIQLIPGEDDEVSSYYVAKYYKGDVFTESTIVQDAINAELFLKILTRGKLPKTIPYSKLLKVWQKNLSMSGVNLGVSSTILEIIISEIYRNKKKPEEKFAKAIGKNPKESEYGYRPADFREVCARNSTFAALTFEDKDQMIVSSININRYNKEESESPIEKIIKM